MRMDHVGEKTCDPDPSSPTTLLLSFPVTHSHYLVVRTATTLVITSPVIAMRRNVTPWHNICDNMAGHPSRTAFQGPVECHTQSTVDTPCETFGRSPSST